MRMSRLAASCFALILLSRFAGALAATDGDSLRVTAVDSIGMTVENMERAVEFYTRVLSFEQVSDVEVSGREIELLQGIFGARMRIVRLRLGDELLELTEYLAPKGRPVPTDMRPNDRAFQHVAIIVSDMEATYQRLRQYHVEHASTGPQRLPDWNPNAGGISAFYFRDPDRHFLEVLHFPPGKGLAKWQQRERLFLGIDHTAIVVGDTEQSLQLYRDGFQMKIAGESENYDTEQEHLNGVFGARLRITALRADQGPGIELLEYLAPRDGLPTPLDLRANDIAHWQTTLIASAPARINDLLPRRIFALVSPNVVALPKASLAIREGIVVRDPDGHGIRLAAR
jgi:catechol 2,3-dioxygenase-like lactoylglutathione lyase family enzyme